MNDPCYCEACTLRREVQRIERRLEAARDALFAIAQGHTKDGPDCVQVAATALVKMER